MCSLAAVIVAPVCDRHWEAFDMAEIVKAVAKHYRITEAEIYGRTKPVRIARARQVAMYLIRTKLKLSYPRIGKFMGRDHTTVLSGRRAVARRIHQAEIDAIFLNLRKHRQQTAIEQAFGEYAKAAAA